VGIVTGVPFVAGLTDSHLSTAAQLMRTHDRRLELDHQRPFLPLGTLAEVFDGKRRSAGEFLHYGTDNHQSDNHRIKADFSKWHVISVEWLRDHIRFYLDGHLHWSVIRNPNPAKNLVPSTKFRLALQNDAGCTGYCHRDSTTPRHVVMEVDWVKIYKAPAGAR
jgi:hypothetical protein